jgi:hypothetical protein
MQKRNYIINSLNIISSPKFYREFEYGTEIGRKIRPTKYMDLISFSFIPYYSFVESYLHDNTQDQVPEEFNIQ